MSSLNDDIEMCERDGGNISVIVLFKENKNKNLRGKTQSNKVKIVI